MFRNAKTTLVIRFKLDVSDTRRRYRRGINADGDFDHTQDNIMNDDHDHYKSGRPHADESRESEEGYGVVLESRNIPSHIELSFKTWTNTTLLEGVNYITFQRVF